MRRGGCDVPVVAAAPLAFAVSSPFVQRGDQGLKTLGPENPCGIRASREDWNDGHEAY